MRTKLTITLIVLTAAAAVGGAFVTAGLLYGWIGLAAITALSAGVLLLYLRVIRPWHSTWGATAEELDRPMPGDEMIPVAASTTRAVFIHRPIERVWPWLTQIGYGRAGWYSYDWIDNDGRPSATDILPAAAHFDVGDTIEMLPGFGPTVTEMEVNSHIVAGDAESGTWCLALYPAPYGCRLVSRWRQDWNPKGAAARFFVVLSDPGAFIMEQRMLRGIKRRAERPRTVGVSGPPARREEGAVGDHLQRL